MVSIREPIPKSNRLPRTVKSSFGGVTSKRSLVSVVDDNDSVRESLPDLLLQLGFDVQAFPSAEAFLESETLRAN
jgi:hypothetical protein